MRYQPLAVLVEVDDPEYRSIQVPDGSAPPGHVWLRAVTWDPGWDLSVGRKQAVQVMRKQLPLAPRCVLTHCETRLTGFFVETLVDEQCRLRLGHLCDVVQAHKAR